jgi:hypothetical protein
MSITVYRVCSLFRQIVSGVPVGTARDLFWLLIAIASGRLLLFRGAVVSALAHLGLDDQAVRRAQAALQRGHYDAKDLVANWHEVVRLDGRFHPHVFEGYRPVALDLVGFHRRRLATCANKHFHSRYGRALPAIVFAIVAPVGAVGRMRLAVPRLILRARPQESDPALSKRALIEAKEALEKGEALLLDAGFPPSAVVPLEIQAYLLRVRKNFVARRNELPARKGRGRPQVWGEQVRPLPRTYNGKAIPATKPDKTARWTDGSHAIRAEVYENLVLPTNRPGSPSFRLVVIYDPRFKEPLLLATNLKISAFAVAQMYRDRWTIEQVPLAAKQVLGAERSCVFGDASRFRLPELAILAGSVLSYVAASSETEATGFWDRCARPTCGRLRRQLSRLIFSDFPIPAGELRKKNSPTGHLKKGVEAHRRSKADRGPIRSPLAA